MSLSKTPNTSNHHGCFCLWPGPLSHIMWPITPAHWTVGSHIFSVNSVYNIFNLHSSDYSFVLSHSHKPLTRKYHPNISTVAENKALKLYLRSRIRFHHRLVFESSPWFISCLFADFIHTEKKQSAKLERKVEDENSCHHKYKTYWSKWHILLILFSSYNVSL